VVTDINMPRMDGLSQLQKLQENEILISAKTLLFLPPATQKESSTKPCFFATAPERIRISG
jgi:CheY-like chemotaxis protein